MCAPTTQGSLSQTRFLSPKIRVNFDKMINLKARNSFVQYFHFKMENINSLIDLLQPGDFLGKVDLKDVYFTVPIHDDYSKYFRFCWNGMLDVFLSLPFKLSSAPRIFTEIMKPIYGVERFVL